MAKHSVSSYRATGMLSRFHAGCDICVCVCVCPGHCFAEEGDPGINNTRLCCSGPSFRGGRGRKLKTRASFIRAFASKGRGGICAGGRTSKTNTRRIYPGHCFGAGGGENRNPRSICQGIGGAGRGSLEYLHQHMKQRVYYCRARLF